MLSKAERLNTSTAFMARRPFVAPVERARRKGAKWHAEGDGYCVDIDDMITERDVDFIEWLIKHGNPRRLRDGRMAFAFSLYAAAASLNCGRGRLLQRIERRMKTIISIQDGDWKIKAQVFGPTLENARDGKYIVTWTPEFVKLFERGLLTYYADLVDEILPISSAVVRRLVRRTISHDKWGPESLEHALKDVRYACETANEQSRRSMVDRAIRDVLDARDYLEAVFGISIVSLADGGPGLQYERDNADRRIWIRRNGEGFPNSREPQPELSGTVGKLSGTVGRTLGNRA